MSSLATLFSLEQEFDVRAYYNFYQVNMLRKYFKGPSFEMELKELEQQFPDWKRLPWTESQP